ncbi:hypothetical protein L1987_46126 [Smallanthus sonchifolius]|uniref:Uncharacterized protein n=1 Tax=Smallanthus sonchifolius TaxID=185202 RepID=A0ACB9FYA1_9ASTR|nr:hypothetical protein L1987_46126 [Smallanthus sonchifolius]
MINWWEHLGNHEAVDIVQEFRIRRRNLQLFLSASNLRDRDVLSKNYKTARHKLDLREGLQKNFRIWSPKIKYLANNPVIMLPLSCRQILTDDASGSLVPRLKDYN